jgi:hypothetical protein
LRRRRYGKPEIDEEAWLSGNTHPSENILGRSRRRKLQSVNPYSGINPVTF